MSSSIEDTQWRSFRSMNRNRPLKQVRILATLLFISCMYMYCLFTPQQAQPLVIELNGKESLRYYQKLQEHSLLLQERRQELAKQRTEARVRRNQARNVTKLHNNNSNTTFSDEHTTPQAMPRILGMFLSLFASLLMCASAQFLHRICNGGGTNPTTTTTTTTTSRAQTRRQERENRFREWARQLNRQRVQQGERPLSLASLRLVVRGRDISTAGNDYEALLRMEEEAGPAMHALLQSMGATTDEINRCPVRILSREDDLLKTSSLGIREPSPHCPVCLETYEIGNQVRTIPCFHTFHTSCIDPWLTQKAVCPVCKHPAVA